MGLYLWISISVTRPPDSNVLYAAVYSNPITDILPVRSTDNVRLCYEKYIQTGSQYDTVHDYMFSRYNCNNENVFWVTVRDYNGNGMFLSIHHPNIAGAFDCFCTCMTQ